MSEQKPSESKFQAWVRDIHRIGLEFKQNELDDSIEVFYDGEWLRLTKPLIAVLKTELREIDYGSRKDDGPGPLGPVMDAWVKLAWKNRYNPIKDYIKSLEGKYRPKPGGPYVNHKFSEYFRNPDQMFGQWLFYWMTGAIAKIEFGERNPMLVLAGVQHIGKSYLARWICPIDKDRYFIEQSIRTEDKDSRLRGADTMIWEVAELGATIRKSDVESLKGFITQRYSRERRSYGEYDQGKPIVCSFIGSVNYDGVGFLNDSTGSTRFLTTEISAIDFDYSKQVDVNDLWAEAYWHYKTMPGCWKLTEAHWAKLAEINQKFEIHSELDEGLDNCFEFTKDPDDFLTTVEIRRHLLSNGYTASDNPGWHRELAKLLYKRGIIQARTAYKKGEPHRQGWKGLKVVNAAKKLD